MKLENTKHQIVILGAGSSTRSELHSALIETENGSRVIDWLLQAYADFSLDLQIVVGYRVNEIELKYPDFKYVYNQEWENTGACGSLFCAEFPDEGDLIVSYSDILYRKSLIHDLINTLGDVVVAIDSQWKDRYQGRSTEHLSKSEKVNYVDGGVTRLGQYINENDADAEFIGVIRFSEKAIKFVKELQKNNRGQLAKTKISYLVEELRIKGLRINYVDAIGDWAEMDDPRDLAHFVLGTKAQTLDRLSEVVTECTILPQYTFSVKNWDKDNKRVVQGVKDAFPDGKIVVRSSALSEDGFTSANAGAYNSVLNINSKSEEEIIAAITDVVNSYTDQDPANQVLVQPMVTDVKMSGVGFTRTLSHGSPYYIINYDDKTGSTESITSGTSTEHKTFILRRDKLEELQGPPASIIQLCKSFREIEQLVNYDSLDIEFAIDSKGKVYVLQVRPIAVDHSEWNITDEELFEYINSAEKKFNNYNQERPALKGKNALFGVMPDWNPAEIIGTNPGRLSTSLYKAIIMNDVWSTQRYEYGYRDVRPTPLLVTFAGHPYVDVRASFNSFIPQGIDDDLAEKLVESYLDYLKQNSQFHDKVEFEVLPTCYDLNFAKWEERLVSYNFKKREIEVLRKALLGITQGAISRNDEFLANLEILSDRFREVKNSALDPLLKAYYLLEDCKRYGTLPFSHLARSAFVAVSLLKSAVEIGILTNEAKDNFLNTINTVSHDFTVGVKGLAKGELEMSDFLEKYGHIRPGTYDITSKNYKEDPDYYIKPLITNDFTTDLEETDELHWESEKFGFIDACNKAGIPKGLDEIESFMRKAIEGREYAKYLFSKNLSLAMDLMLEYANSYNISREELSHISWDELFATRELEPNFKSIKNHLVSLSIQGARWKDLGSSVEIPPLITSKKDFWWFYYPESQANFIGSGIITAECIDISTDFNEDTPLNGKIVMIPRADPGYEWLFGRNIGGLITMYGGANSHMAIRAAEFNLPAAIGVGEKEYKRISGVKVLTLNAANRKLDIIQ